MTSRPRQSADKTPRRMKAGKAARPEHNAEGLESRLAATGLVTIVADKHASMEDLTDPQKGLTAYLKLDERDKALARAIALTTLRHKVRIEAILKKCWNRKPPQKARFLLHTLETAAAQILFMDVPQSAAVNLATGAIRRERSTTRFAGFANAVLRALTRDREKLMAETANTVLFPPVLAKRLTSDFGREKLAAMSKAIAMEPVLDLQTKPGIKMPADEFLALPGNAHRLMTARQVSELPGYDKGNWWVQDIAAAQPARLLGNVSGKTVADLCAAPGGKTMQLAATGANVTSVDISAKRLERLEENLARTGLSANIVCADILQWNPEVAFDAILLDAPCSATGTVRRHPDILWNTQESEIAKLVALQKTLIARISTFLKPGGILVYANCSLLKAEGEDLVASLGPELATAGLETLPVEPDELPGLEFCLNGRGQFRSLPHYLEADPQEKSGMDGFFAARFIRGNAG